MTFPLIYQNKNYFFIKKLKICQKAEQKFLLYNSVSTNIISNEEIFKLVSIEPPSELSELV